MQVWSILCLAIILSDTYLGSLSAESQPPLTRYAIDVKRYRFGSSPDHMDPAFYPIPQIKVACDTYLQGGVAKAPMGKVLTSSSVQFAWSLKVEKTLKGKVSSDGIRGRYG